MVSRFPAAFRLPAFASWILLFPPVELCFPCGRPTGRLLATRTPTGFPRYARTRPSWGGRPLYPGNRGVLRLRIASHSRRVPPCNGRSLYPGLVPSAGAAPDEASTRGSLIVRPSSLPLHLWPPDGTGALGLDPLSFVPRSYPRRTSGWGRTTDTGAELHLRHRTSLRCVHLHRATSRRTRDCALEAQHEPVGVVVGVIHPVAVGDQREAERTQVQ